MTQSSASAVVHPSSSVTPSSAPAPTVVRDGATAAEWDAFVRGQAGWTHFHLHGWRDVIGEVFGHECLYLAARGADGALRGVLPLVRVKSIVFGHYLMSMPFLNYGGPLGDAAAVRALADEAVRLAQRGGAKLLELRSAVPLDVPLPVSHRKITVLLDLVPDGERMFKTFDAKLRSQVRRPQKEGVEVRHGLDQVGAFHRVFAEHMRDLGTPTLPERLFAAIARRFPDSTRVAVAYLDGAPVAGGWGFVYGDEFEITWASALVAHKKIAPNMLVYWELIRQCAESGLARFNFGRCTPGGGTHKFKRQWGGYDQPLHWYQWAPGGEAKTPSPDDGAFAWGPRLWKKLPLPVASVLGPRIVKFIP